MQVWNRIDLSYAMRKPDLGFVCRIEGSMGASHRHPMLRPLRHFAPDLASGRKLVQPSILVVGIESQGRISVPPLSRIARSQSLNCGIEALDQATGPVICRDEIPARLFKAHTQAKPPFHVIAVFQFLRSFLCSGSGIAGPRFRRGPAQA